MSAGVTRSGMLATLALSSVFDLLRSEYWELEPFNLASAIRNVDLGQTNYQSFVSVYFERGWDLRFIIVINVEPSIVLATLSRAEIHIFSLTGGQTQFRGVFLWKRFGVYWDGMDKSVAGSLPLQSNSLNPRIFERDLDNNFPLKPIPQSDERVFGKDRRFTHRKPMPCWRQEPLMRIPDMAKVLRSIEGLVSMSHERN